MERTLVMTKTERKAHDSLVYQFVEAEKELEKLQLIIRHNAKLLHNSEGKAAGFREALMLVLDALPDRY